MLFLFIGCIGFIDFMILFSDDWQCTGALWCFTKGRLKSRLLLLLLYTCAHNTRDFTVFKFY